MTTVTARRPPGPVRWNDAAVTQLRAAVLTDSLGRLRRCATESATHREILTWLRSDAVHPFSFVVCARSCGCDPRALRDGVLAALGTEVARPSARASVGLGRSARWSGPAVGSIDAGPEARSPDAYLEE
jgi:hypothetical protein